jgi:hypothetical protein
MRRTYRGTTITHTPQETEETMSKKLMLGVVMLIELAVGVLGMPTAALAVQEPVTVDFYFSALPPASGKSVDIYTVPAGKRLILEFVSMECSVPSNQRVNMAIVRKLVTAFSLANTYQYTISGTAHYTASQMVRIYADAGDVIQVFGSRNGAEGTMTCTVAFSGSLESD